MTGQILVKLDKVKFGRGGGIYSAVTDFVHGMEYG
jgi:hypothetical protein